MSVLMAIAMVMMAFGGIVAHAEASEGLTITATRDGDTLRISYVVLEDVICAGGSCTKPVAVADEEVFEYTGFESDFGIDIEYGNQVDIYPPDYQNGNQFYAGDVILTLIYNITDKFQEGVVYTFESECTEFYDKDCEDYENFLGDMTATYMEPADEPTPTAEPTVAPTPTAEPTAKPEDVIYVKKTVRSETNYGTETFNFKAECVSVEGNNGQVSPSDAPAITIDPITMTYSDTEKTVDLPSLTFPMGGVYTYKITEVNGGADFWSYDSTEYYIVFEVEPDRAGNLVIDRYYIHKDSATGDDSKAEEIEFVNTYAALTDLTITKTVVGGTAGEDVNPMADVMFDFSIEFDKTFTGKINGEDVPFTAGEPYTFQLGNGGELNIGNIPAGAKYTLKEAGKEYYTGSAVVVSGDSSKPVNGEYATELTVTGTAEPTDELGINKVDVTNTYSIPPITGITMHGEMIAIIALALVALVGGFVLSRKLRRSED